ncbi:MAG: AraC family transcriptional regulator [Clostridia bacterium]|nr:AraC family transcriptional regulator [Clostridia bacterium]
MNACHIEAINKINLSDLPRADRVFSVLWIMAAGEHNKSTQSFYFHIHTFYEIHLILQGSIVYGFEGGNVTVSKDQFLLILPMQAHRVVETSPDFVKVTLAFEVCDNPSLDTALERKSKKLFRTGEEILDGMEMIVRRADQKSAYSDLIIAQRLDEILYLILEAISVPAPLFEHTRGYDDRLLKAKKYIEDNPGMFFTCNEVADYCRISPKQLGRLFRKYEKQSVLAFIHAQKIEAAKHLLRNTDTLQETISRSLGFSNVQYFNKFFIRHTGMTPSEYRRGKEA